ncbi:MAG: MerR family transcriptional regulator [Lachnospiraceae bacterium]|nr:MerR family transcriptional regulator [Lachnospiraceae bacterium]
MRIQEVEFKTGLTRANIRFYEKEGLIEIDRKENGYRDYSEEDVETLLKIKLLRQLNVTIGDIRGTQQSKVELSEILEKRLVELVREMKDLEKSKMVCKEICEDRTSYQQLDARKYLSLMEKEIIYMKQNHISISTNVEKDVIKHEPQPWRRYFAREMDYAFYSVLWGFLFFVLFRQRDEGLPGLILWIMVLFAPILFTIFMEPLFLSVFGTTPGKWVLGISVLHGEGRKLTYREGLGRTLKLICYGEGFYIPIYRECRIYECMGIYLNQKKMLPWDEEYDCEYRFKDSKVVRGFIYVAVDIIFVLLYIYMVLYSFTPIHRGNISLAEFSANYNEYLKENDFYQYSYLDREGKWQGKEATLEAESSIEYGNNVIFLSHPQFEYIEKDGVLVEVSLKYAVNAGKKGSIFWNFDNEIRNAIYSFACAQSGMNAIEIYKTMKDIEEKINVGYDEEEKCSFNIDNVKINYKSKRDYKKYYEVTFSMKLQ